MTRITFGTPPLSVVSSIYDTWTASVGGVFSRPTGPGHSGGALYGRLSSTGTPAVVLGPMFAAPPVGGALGQTVAVSAWVKGTVGLGAEMMIVWSDASTSLVGGATLASTTTWVQIQGVISVPPGVTGQVRFRNLTATNGNLDFDDITLDFTTPGFNVIEYSVTENGGNLDASKLDGGVPQITTTILDYASSNRLMDDQVVLSDNVRGTMTGTVRNLARSNGVLTVTADTAMSLLNTYRTVPPMNSANFGAYVTDLFAYLNIPVTTSVQSAIASHVFPFVGFTGNVFDQLKALSAARNYEISMVDTTIRFRASRANSLNETNITDSGDALNSQQSAQQVVVNYKNYSSYGNFAAYPPIGSNPADISPITVNANEIVVQTFPISGTAASVTQPTPVDSITIGGTSQYAVIGNDGLPVQAAQWVSEGGKVKVRVLPDDPSQIEVTVTGSGNTALAPYRIAESSGNTYGALYIRAQGIASNPSSVTINTGAPANVTSELVGVTVDNPYIDTLADAYSNGMIVAANYAGPQYTMNGTSPTLNSPSNSGLILGYGIGNRILRKNVNFIVTSTTTSADAVQYTATLDTIIDDFNTAWSGQTFDAFNTQWSGYSFTEMTPIPLWRS